MLSLLTRSECIANSHRTDKQGLYIQGYRTVLNTSSSSHSCDTKASFGIMGSIYSGIPFCLTQQRNHCAIQGFLYGCWQLRRVACSSMTMSMPVSSMRFLVVASSKSESTTSARQRSVVAPRDVMDLYHDVGSPAALLYSNRVWIAICGLRRSPCWLVPAASICCCSSCCSSYSTSLRCQYQYTSLGISARCRLI